MRAVNPLDSQHDFLHLSRCCAVPLNRTEVHLNIALTHIRFGGTLTILQLGTIIEEALFEGVLSFESRYSVPQRHNLQIYHLQSGSVDMLVSGSRILTTRMACITGYGFLFSHL